MATKKEQDESRRRGAALVNAMMVAKVLELVANGHCAGEEDGTDVAVTCATLARHIQREVREATP